MLPSAVILLATLALVFADSCPPGGVYNEDYNKCYMFNTIGQEYILAETNCKNSGGHLVSIANAFESSIIQQNAGLVFQAYNDSDYWIGANDLVTPGVYQWTDGNPMQYTKWAAGQPQQGYDCVRQRTSDGQWFSDDCSAVKKYVCEVPPIVASTCPPPPTCPTMTCAPQPMCTQKQCSPHCDSEWTYYAYTGFCYKVFFDAKWDDAEAFCVMENAHLASIHSEQEDTFLSNMASTKLTQTNPVDLTWIGMHIVDNAWIWTDGTPSDYFNWAPKQPDNPGKENCVELASDKSKDGWYENWNNENCGTMMRAYICKKGAYTD